VRSEPGSVFVCENPAVLRAAAERLGPASAPLVCTEGRPSVAAATLLDRLVAGGAVLHPRADFDWPGLAIGGALLARPGTRPWRFAAADYERARRARVTNRPALGGSPVASPWSPALAIRDGGRGRVEARSRSGARQVQPAGVGANSATENAQR
jgi:uncharacterized protein (TIGR02679 family)